MIDGEPDFKRMYK